MFNVDIGKYKDSLVSNTEKYLEFLDSYSYKCTFFVVGEVAKRYPDLIHNIVSCDHEIACHTMKHIPLDKLNEKRFKEDLDQNIHYLINAGASQITGFRAPIYSLTQKTKWVYDILNEFGFKYSSSVLPAYNPLYGWPGFGQQTKEVLKGFYEIPITLSGLPVINIPFSGGVYFRILPFFIIKYLFNRAKLNSEYITGYFHPHDIDTTEIKHPYKDIPDNIIYNFLLYYNRDKVLRRLHRLIKDFNIITYSSFINNLIKK